MVHMYIVKHNFILGGMCYYTKAQLHVSAIKVGHLQVAHENLSICCTNVCGGVYRMWGVAPPTSHKTPQTHWYSLLVSSHVQPEDGQL